MSNLKRKAGGVADDHGAKKSKPDASITSFFAPPAAKANGAAFSSPAVKFSKDKWVASLTPEQKELLQLEIDTMDPSWLALLKDDLVTQEFLNLKKFLKQETASKKKWFPPAEDVYSWSRHTPFNNVKIVIVGQDPYHNVNQAHGMAFSVRPPTPAPPSLRNMYIALKKDYPTFVQPENKGGYLMPWADRGVLMLNTCLTVRAHEAFSHSNRGWERLTQKVIDLISQKRTRGVVFMAWGTPAGKRVARIDKKRHLVLQSAHPSPLSASRGFFDCGHFRKANEWLINRYGEDGEVDWALVPGNTTKAPEKKEVADEKNKENGELNGVGIDSDDEDALEEALLAAEEAAKKADASTKKDEDPKEEDESAAKPQEKEEKDEDPKEEDESAAKPQEEEEKDEKKDE
ncbi:hypothetical protein N3K66_005583 [Trichothecium roseum]|uniref:Uncharacterized protein n=1 Tax=Trichothecium roseum TaxID=47278 RepID=A0ACC0UYA0_9HYPO|nr:hypothetical protein N3K66_005583 [Trichothecium roseum]